MSSMWHVGAGRIESEHAEIARATALAMEVALRNREEPWGMRDGGGWMPSEGSGVMRKAHEFGHCHRNPITLQGSCVRRCRVACLSDRQACRNSPTK